MPLQTTLDPHLIDLPVLANLIVVDEHDLARRILPELTVYGEDGREDEGER